MFNLKRLYWNIKFASIGERYYPIGGAGGDDPEPPTPQPVQNTTETASQSIQAQIDATPDILATQQEFGPQFTQLQLDQLTEFGPQFAEQALQLSQDFGGSFAQQVRDEQGILAPERVAGSEAITDFINAGAESLSPEEIREIEQSARSAASARGFGSSGFSAEDEILRLFQVRQGLKNRFLDVSLSASGRLPAAGGQTVGNAPQAGGPGQLVQNVSPSTFFGGQASQNASNASIFGTQGGIFGNQLQNSGGFGSIVGGIAGQAAGGLFGAGGKFGQKI